MQKIEPKNNWKNLPTNRNKNGEIGQLSAIDAAGGLDSNGLEMSVASRGNLPLPPSQGQIPQDIQPDYMGPK